MNRKLTPEQAVKLASFHKNPLPAQMLGKHRTTIITDPDEVAKIMPNIISHYVVKRRHHSTDNQPREEDR